MGFSGTYYYYFMVIYILTQTKQISSDDENWWQLKIVFNWTKNILTTFPYNHEHPMKA